MAFFRTAMAEISYQIKDWHLHNYDYVPLCHPMRAPSTARKHATQAVPHHRQTHIEENRLLQSQEETTPIWAQTGPLEEVGMASWQWETSVHRGIHGTFWDPEISKNKKYLDGINDEFWWPTQQMVSSSLRPRQASRQVYYGINEQPSTGLR